MKVLDVFFHFLNTLQMFASSKNFTLPSNSSRCRQHFFLVVVEFPSTQKIDITGWLLNYNVSVAGTCPISSCRGATFIDFERQRKEFIPVNVNRLQF